MCLLSENQLMNHYYKKTRTLMSQSDNLKEMLFLNGYISHKDIAKYKK
jgi:hypothetical protein